MYLATVPGCCTRKAVGYAMVGSTRHRARCARLSTWRPAGARRGERRRSSTPGRGSQYTSAHAQLADHLEDYGTPPPSGKDRGVLGGCLGGSRRVRP